MSSQDLSAVVSFLKDLRSRVSPDDAGQVKNFRPVNLLPQQ